MTDWHMEEFDALIPESLKDSSGKVFYSGRRAFESPSSVYILGINPGRAPPQGGGETVREHTAEVLACEDHGWSAYQDESWGPNLKRGSATFQKRVQYLCNKISMDVREVPASNVIFERSPDFASLGGRAKCVAKKCWPFHRKVIDTLGVRIVVCLGANAGHYVRQKLNADCETGEFVEKNKRRWRSRIHKSPDGIQVVTLAHPSRSDWTKRASDPTHLVVQALHDLGQQQP